MQGPARSNSVSVRLHILSVAVTRGVYTVKHAVAVDCSKAGAHMSVGTCISSGRRLQKAMYSGSWLLCDIVMTAEAAQGQKPTKCYSKAACRGVH